MKNSCVKGAIKILDSLPHAFTNPNLKFFSGQADCQLDHPTETGTRQDDFGSQTGRDDWTGFEDGGNPDQQESRWHPVRGVKLEPSLQLCF